MRTLVLTCIFSLAASMAVADPNATVFPPTNCIPGMESLISTLYGGGSAFSSTKCKTGQEVMKLAIPTCAENQQVVYKNSLFVCENKPNLPTMCESDQVLTYTASGFICVKVGESVPTCGKDQFLTYNGSTFQCATVQQLAIPTCGENQMLSGNNGKLECRTLPTVAEKSFGSYESRNVDTEYTAETDGYAVFWAGCGMGIGRGRYFGYVNGTMVIATVAQDLPPLVNGFGESEIDTNSFTMPVPKGAKWKVVTNEASSDCLYAHLNWIPTAQAK